MSHRGLARHGSGQVVATGEGAEAIGQVCQHIDAERKIAQVRQIADVLR